MPESDIESGIDRRSVVQSLGAAGVIGLAGCSGIAGNDGGGGETTELSVEEPQTREEVADHLDTISSMLRTEAEGGLEMDDETVFIAPPEEVDYQIEIEDQEKDDGVQREVEFKMTYMRTDDEEPLTEDGV